MRPSLDSHHRILVIRLGALGDLTLCMKAFHDIRAAHPRAQIALLTMPPFVDFARVMPWFDQTIADMRPSAWNIEAWLDLRRRIRDFDPTMVYDLQGKNRQAALYYLLGGPWKGPQWSGGAPGCVYPRPWPPKEGAHFTDFIADQLRAAGVPDAGMPDFAWLDAPTGTFALPERYVMFIPGSSPDRLYKRWPAVAYAELAQRLATRGIASIAIGGRADMDAIDAIARQAPQIINLGGKTSLMEVAGLARRALHVLGNDTGPTHIAAAVGAPTLALFAAQVNPVWSCPRGPQVRWLQGDPIDALSVDQVLTSLWLDRID